MDSLVDFVISIVVPVSAFILCSAVLSLQRFLRRRLGRVEPSGGEEDGPSPGTAAVEVSPQSLATEAATVQPHRPELIYGAGPTYGDLSLQPLPPAATATTTATYGSPPPLVGGGYAIPVGYGQPRMTAAPANATPPNAAPPSDEPTEVVSDVNDGPL